MQTKRFWHGLIWLMLLTAIQACAARSTYYDDVQGGEMVTHSFKFDARRDSPDIEIIDYRYGTSKARSVQNKHDERAQGKSQQSDSAYGRMLRGTELYVKWRIKSTGEVLEDRVDLKSRQPANIENHGIYFIVDDKKLYIYLISHDPVREVMSLEEAQEKDDAVRGSRIEKLKYYARNSVIQIYPTREKIFPYFSKNKSK